MGWRFKKSPRDKRPSIYEFMAGKVAKRLNPARFGIVKLGRLITLKADGA